MDRYVIRKDNVSQADSTNDGNKPVKNTCEKPKKVTEKRKNGVTNANCTNDVVKKVRYTGETSKQFKALSEENVKNA